MHKERLYDAFGELIYALAISDGNIQKEEIKALEDYLKNYEGAQKISWSFNYEMGKAANIDDAYKKALTTCLNNGPDAEYEVLFGLLDAVANSNFMEEKQKKLIQQFKNELRDEFLKRY